MIRTINRPQRTHAIWGKKSYGSTFQEETLKQHLDIIGGIGAGIFAYELMMVCFSMILCRKIGSADSGFEDV